MALGLDLEGLAHTSRDEDIEVLRVGSDPIDRATPPPELANDDLHPGAVIVDHFRDRGRRHVLIAGRSHFQRGRQVGPQLEAVHLPALAGFGHFLVHDAAAGGHPLDIARAEAAFVAQRVSVIDGAG